MIIKTLSTCIIIMMAIWIVKTVSILICFRVFVVDMSFVTEPQRRRQQRQLYTTIQTAGTTRINTYAENITQVVSLLPFQISIVLTTISSPDAIHYALTEYLMNHTTTNVRSIQLLLLLQQQSSVDDPTETMGVSTEQYKYNNDNDDDNVVVPTLYMYNGSAVVSTEYGSMTESLVQTEQWMALTDPNLEVMLQYYYDMTIYPYVGQLHVRGIELTEPSSSSSSVSSPNDSMVDTTADDVTTTTTAPTMSWYTIAIVSVAGGIGCATILVFIAIAFVTHRQYWEDQLQSWKYNVERERTLQSQQSPPQMMPVTRFPLDDDDGPIRIRVYDERCHDTSASAVDAETTTQ